MMFHYQDNLFFGRMGHGAVRLLKFDGRPGPFPDAEGLYTTEDGVLLDVVIDKDSWASIVTAVSAKDQGMRVDQAVAFHEGR